MSITQKLYPHSTVPRALCQKQTTGKACAVILTWLGDSGQLESYAIIDHRFHTAAADWKTLPRIYLLNLKASTWSPSLILITFALQVAMQQLVPMH